MNKTKLLSMGGHVINHMLAGVIIITVFTSAMFPQAAAALNIPDISQLLAKNTQKADVFPTSGDIAPRQTSWVTMTAYSSDVGQTDDSPCIPAMHTYNLCENYEESGARDTIAANFLPLGTKVRFPDLYGDKIFTVRDRMNKRYGQGRGDIWMPTRAEAVIFGVKQVKMEVYYR